VALVAIHTVVHIASNTLVCGIRLGLRVAVCTGEDRVVVRIRVAGAAHTVGVAMVQREPGVIELAIRPLDRVVAGCTGGREMGGDVVRIVRILVVRLVAAIAVRGQVFVIVVDVAVGAGARRYGMRAREGEAGLVVVKVGVGPFDRVMADLAGLRKASLHVIRVIRVVEIGQVASDAGGVVELVIVVDVAVRALSRWHRVRTGQGPASLRVIEFAVSPGHGVVAGFAGQGQAGLDVIYGTNRVVVVLLMAGNAGRLVELVVTIDVAVGAGTRRHGV